MSRKIALGLTLIFVLMGMLCMLNRVHEVEASGTIYIRADGGVEPDTAPISTVDNVTYTFLGNINESIVVERDNILVDGAGYTLQGTGTHESRGINLWGRSNVTVKNLKINAFYWGIYLYGSSKNTISENEVESNSYGIRLEHSSNNSVLGNNVTNNGAGIMPYYSSTNNRIIGNNIARNTYGMDVYSSSNNSIFENNIEANDNGGIEIRVSSNNNSIYRNDITENRYGIFFVAQSSNNTVCGNNITSNQCGIWLNGCSNNVIHHNNFINNTNQVGVSESDDTWDDGYPSGGNYWSDYTGVDVNGDGIGDTPYVIDENNTDRYPLMHPWSSLPVHNINTGSGYAKIQEAMNANRTLDGHTILVDAGTYYEHVVVNKSISLIGQDRSTTTIDGNGTGTVVTITENNINVTGFTIQNSGIYEEAGIYLNNVTHCNITQNSITSNDDGIYSYESSNNAICGNNIATNFYSGISFSVSSNNTVCENNITNNFNGIIFRDSSNNNISGNNITANNDDGISLEYYSNGNTISGNNITDSEYAITLGSYSNGNTISGNIITNNGSERVIFGIGLAFSSNNTVCGNNITNNDYSITLGSSSNNTITGNSVTNNDYGISVWRSSNNTVYHNNFVGNTKQVNNFESGNIWDNGVEGNYWSNYTGVDSDHDGIGDTFHVLDANNTDHYPLMGLFHSFNTTLGKHINVISNSTIDDFEYFEFNGTAKMYVSNMTTNQTHGFCRVCIPHALMNAPNISVVIDDGVTAVLHANYDVYGNTTHRWIYFAYEHSTHKIDIIPEFPSLLVISLFMIATLLAFIVHRLRNF